MRSSAQPLLWKALNLVLIFAFLKTRRKLGRVTFRKDVWDRYWGRAIQLLANRPLPSSKNPRFQNEAKCTTFLVKMSFICMRMKNDFHIKGWAPTLVFKQKPGGTRKWPILNSFNQSKLEAGACRRSKGREKVLADQWNAKLLSDPINQSKLKAGACSWRYARENVCKQVTIELLLPLIGWKVARNVSANLITWQYKSKATQN